MFFIKAPLKDKWDQFTISDLKIEYLVEKNLTTATKTYDKVFWVGNIRKYFGKETHFPFIDIVN